VDADQLREEQNAESEKEKSQRQIYEQLRKNVPNDDKEEENVCTIEEVVVEEPI